MSDKLKDFQPGAILHGVIIAAFRAKGETLNHWCVANGVTQSHAYNATYGRAAGAKSKAVLADIIEAAGSEVVSDLYARQVKAEYVRVTQ